MEEFERNDYKRTNLFVVSEKFNSDEEAREYIKKAKYDDSVMETVIMKNLPMINMYAKHYVRCGSSFDDLQAEGIIAVMKAIRDFDCDSTVTVGTVLITAVRTALRRYAGRDKNVRCGINANESKQKIHAVKNSIEKYGNTASVEEIADKCNTSVKRVENLLSIDNTTISMNIETESKDGESTEIGDSLVSNAVTPFEEISSKEEMNMLFSLLEKLESIERFVIKNHYGLDCEKKTFSEIAEMIGKCTAMVAKIEDKAIEKMRLMIA